MNPLNLITRTVFMGFFVLIFSSLFAQSEDSAPLAPSLDMEKLAQMEARIRESDASVAARISELEKSLNANNVASVIKDAHVLQFIGDCNNLELRYRAGEELLFAMYKQNSIFKDQFAMLQMQAEFSTLTNPIGYPNFRESIEDNLRRLRNKPIPDPFSLNGLVPFLANPTFGTALSLVSYFVAKTENVNVSYERLNELNCIMDFTHRVESEYVFFRKSLEYQQRRIEAFDNKTREFMREYLKAVEYPRDLNDYVSQRASDPTDFMARFTSKLFNEIRRDTVQIGLVTINTTKDDNVRYQVEKVKYYIVEYESILSEMESSIEHYENFISKLKGLQRSGCSQSVTNFITEKIRSIESRVQDLKSTRKNMLLTIALNANQKSRLFGY